MWFKILFKNSLISNINRNLGLLKVIQQCDARLLCKNKHTHLRWNKPLSSWTKKCAIGGGLGIGLIGLTWMQYDRNSPLFFRKNSSVFSILAAEVRTDTDERSPTKVFNFIADVVEKTAPSVVYIEIKGRHPFHNHPVTLSNGSGFIVRSDGLVLTNAHVVANRQLVTVKLYDGRIFEGQVEDVDLNADLATIRINAKDLPTLKLGNSSKLRPGEWVVAIGSPLALNNTITTGVISSVHRASKELGLHDKEMNYIQTDAAINVGNSGGPLVNLNGEAIGINTMKVTPGISFAVPSDYAVEFLKATESRKKAWFGGGEKTVKPRKNYIGITMLTLTPSIIMELQQRSQEYFHVDHGVLVWRVVVGSPAHISGLQPGDIITRINGSPIKSSNDVYKALEAGKPLRLEVHRKKEVLSLFVQPEEVVSNTNHVRQEIGEGDSDSSPLLQLKHQDTPLCSVQEHYCTAIEKEYQDVVQ